MAEIDVDFAILVCYYYDNYFRKVVRGMNISTFECGGKVISSLECIKGYSFDIACLWDSCAILPVICAGFAHLRDSSANFYSIKCLLPFNIAA